MATSRGPPSRATPPPGAYLGLTWNVQVALMPRVPLHPPLGRQCRAQGPAACWHPHALTVLGFRLLSVQVPHLGGRGPRGAAVLAGGGETGHRAPYWQFTTSVTGATVFYVFTQPLSPPLSLILQLQSAVVIKPRKKQPLRNPRGILSGYVFTAASPGAICRVPSLDIIFFA